MNDTDIQAALGFAKNCIREANRYAARGQHRMAAELRAPAIDAIRRASAAVGHLRDITPAQEKARAIAAVLLAGMH